ncbi:hypothetical protein BJ138DRAFT_1013384, partial [Hygrophoropsis aurantiaca]
STGCVLYKVDTPFESIWAPRTSTIWKARADRSSQPNQPLSPPGDAKRDLENFFRLAEIDWRTISSSRVRWFGLAGADGLGVGETDTSDFIPSTGLLFLKRTFTAPDGIKYSWTLGIWVCKLYREGSHRPVAIYHRWRPNFFGMQGHQGYLEINLNSHCFHDSRASSRSEFELNNPSDGQSPVNAAMLDIIVMTFIYCEKLRRERERGSQQDMRWGF